MPSIFGHKKEFGSVDPVVGMKVSFLLEDGEKGATSKKIREEDWVPDEILTDEGRDFGTVKVNLLWCIRVMVRRFYGLTWSQGFDSEKGFGFIVPKKGGEK